MRVGYHAFTFSVGRFAPGRRAVPTASHTSAGHAHASTAPTTSPSYAETAPTYSTAAAAARGRVARHRLEAQEIQTAHKSYSSANDKVTHPLLTRREQAANDHGTMSQGEKER
eukprot:GHVT01105150.1.p2 GENE.GHVT01105150.1~~GHVT01105150.1.p2  ORF type:complete len:113 (-),score=19.75 GHVT01105150.1:1131-1469(-)